MHAAAKTERDSVRLRVLRWLAMFLFVPAFTLLAAAPQASAAPSPGEGVEQSLGNDVSWPQCDKSLPKGQAFAIVGVNNGLANTTNPCLAEQLEWAETSSHHPDQPTVALYVNTANPGLAGSWWPSSNEYPEGTAVRNPYGTCESGEISEACSYMYGYAKAYDDAYIRGINNPSSYLWWLDVETENSWSTHRAANRAVLEGMTDFFHSIGADVGIYSSRLQWRQIVGPVRSSSSLYSLPSWLAGASTERGAEANCSRAPLTAGGKVSLAQFVYGGYDYNVSCS